jgi:hypothetical protein
LRVVHKDPSPPPTAPPLLLHSHLPPPPTINTWLYAWVVVADAKNVELWRDAPHISHD